MADDLEKRHKRIVKRAFPRVEKALTVQYSVKQFPQTEGMQPAHEFPTDISRTKDLSEQGISFTASNPFPLQTILKIKLQVPMEEQQATIELEACVVGCARIKKIVYRISVKFIKLAEEQRKRLRDFVQVLLKS